MTVEPTRVELGAGEVMAKSEAAETRRMTPAKKKETAKPRSQRRKGMRAGRI